MPRLRSRPFLGLGTGLTMLASGSAMAAQLPADHDAVGTLAQSVRVLARRPGDLTALLAAGKAALQTGDPTAAVGFFGRARDADSSSAAAHAGLAATLVALGRPQAALPEFEKAQALGADLDNVSSDLGLAYDLLGDQPAAQARYRAALDRNGNDARERLALSLAITGDYRAAANLLQPLLDRDVRSAYRVRALVLALSGNIEGSKAALEELGPGAGSAAEPFLRQLASLTAGEKAAAVNLGLFPSDVAVGGPEFSVPKSAEHLSGASGKSVQPMEYGSNSTKSSARPEDQARSRLALYGVFTTP